MGGRGSVRANGLPKIMFQDRWLGRASPSPRATSPSRPLARTEPRSPSQSNISFNIGPHPMTAPFLQFVFDSVYVLSLAVWVGGLVLFPVGGQADHSCDRRGPKLGNDFSRASESSVHQCLRCGRSRGVAVLRGGSPQASPKHAEPIVAVQASVILAGILLMLYTGNVLLPALDAARGAGPEAERTLDRLQRRGAGLNALALVLGGGLLIAFATRPPMRTTGIIEPSPGSPAAG